MENQVKKKMPKPKTQVIKMDKISNVKEIFYFCCRHTLSKPFFLSVLADIFIKEKKSGRIWVALTKSKF